MTKRYVTAEDLSAGRCAPVPVIEPRESAFDFERTMAFYDRLLSQEMARNGMVLGQSLTTEMLPIVPIEQEPPCRPR